MALERPLAGVLLATLVYAADVPVAGERLELRAGHKATARAARLILRDPAIAPPFADPRSTRAALLLNAGAGDGQCAVAIALDTGGWRALRDGGFRSRRPPARASGVRRVAIEPGRITVDARGRRWPCDLAAASRLPVSAVVVLGDTRYCAGFGGTVAANRARRFAARAAPPPAGCPTTRLTVADLNVLHGLFCPTATDGCRRPERTSLLFDWIRASGCPDVVTLQEVSRQGAPLVLALAGSVCPFPYAAVYPSSNGVDDELILTRYPAAVVEQTTLHNRYRTVLFARLDHPLGPVEVFSTHLASGSDGAETPCGANCPGECVDAGAATVRQCQAVQMARFVAARHRPAAPALVTGDFNESPGSFVHRQFTGRGWPDVYLAAGRPECDPVTGVGCTSGRIDDALDQMESRASNEIERIDFVFLVPPAAPRCTVDPLHTGLFAAEPNPFAAACGPAPAPICWPSDHEGVQAALDCR